MSTDSHDNRTTLLRWNDYLTGRTCTLRMADSDAGSPLGELVARYLTNADPSHLADDGMILDEAVETFRDIQDVAHTIDDDGRLVSISPGTVFRAGVQEMSPRETPPRTRAKVRDSEVGLVDLTIDRSETGYSRNWTGFDRRRWERSAAEFESFVEMSVEEHGKSDSDEVLALESRDSQFEFLKRVAKAIWDSPFENYSRFIGRRLRYKTGDEALSSIIERPRLGGGSGGSAIAAHNKLGAICSEKVQALKFVADRYGFESHYVFAGPDAPGPLPLDRLRHILDTFDFRGAGPAMRYWQHMALEFVVGGERVLVDATNGNIPFMFVRGDEVERILDAERPRPITIKMGIYPERFYYHRAPEKLALDLCYAMESFIPEIDLVQVFDNELGLVITPEFLVAPLPYASDADLDALIDLYRTLTEPRGLPFDADPEWRLDGPLGARFQETEPVAAKMVLDSYEHLLDRYNEFEDERHEMGLAVIGLVPAKSEQL